MSGGKHVLPEKQALKNILSMRESQAKKKKRKKMTVKTLNSFQRTLRSSLSETDGSDCCGSTAQYGRMETLGFISDVVTSVTIT